MSNLPKFSIRELLEAGVHFGHRTMRWNPKMAPYIYGSRNGTHIINLQKTAPMLQQALQVVHDVVKQNGRVLFVGTKRQASEPIAEAAKRCGQYYVNYRWLGGMLTNWSTVSKSIKTLRDIETILQGDVEGYKKKELLSLERKADKLRLALGGIMDMGGKPDLLFIIDTNKESLAIKEAGNLGVPVIAIADTNSNPDGVDFLVPGNDDATRSISLYCDLIAKSALAGIQESLGAAGVEINSIADLPQELLPSAKNDNRAKAPKKAEKAEKEEVKEEKKTIVTTKKEATKKAAKKEDATSDESEEEKPAAKKAPAKKPAAKKPAAKK